MRHFVRQSIKGGRCSALIQYSQSTMWDEVFFIISKEINVNGNTCEVLDKYLEYTNKKRKIIEDEYDSQYKDYGDINQEDKEKYLNEKLSKLPVHEKLQELNLNDVLMDFDATSLSALLCGMKTLFILN